MKIYENSFSVYKKGGNKTQTYKSNYDLQDFKYYSYTLYISPLFF